MKTVTNKLTNEEIRLTLAQMTRFLEFLHARNNATRNIEVAESVCNKLLNMYDVSEKPVKKFNDR